MAECHPVGFQWVMEAEGARRHHHSRRSALHAHQRGGRHPRADSRRHRHRVPGRHRSLHSRERSLLPRLRGELHQRAGDLIEDFSDTEDLDGLFSGWDPEKGEYDQTELDVRGRRTGAAAGARELFGSGKQQRRRFRRSTPTQRCSIRAASSRSHAATSRATRRRWWRRPAAFRADCSSRSPRRCASNSGRERTSAFCYAVGWTQHTVGVQYIRTAAIIQLLLGNMGRPGGGILALRGHASIQGSTDIPTLVQSAAGLSADARARAARYAISQTYNGSERIARRAGGASSRSTSSR